jgi:hypothetical protein
MAEHDELARARMGSDTDQMFGRKSGTHTHRVTHPAWISFPDGDCVVCDAQRADADRTFAFIAASLPDETPM